MEASLELPHQDNRPDVPVTLREAMQRMHDPWGGLLCLDFANTVEPRGGPAPDPPPGQTLRDELRSYDDLVAWTARMDALPVETATALLISAGEDPGGAQEIFARGITLREAIYRIFWATAHEQAPDEGDLVILAREYADGAAHASLVASGEGVAWRWPEDGQNLARPIWPVAWSATELLTTGDLQRVKVCPGVPGQPVPCSWLFYDTTRSRTRRWCSMGDCGGAVKARRQSERRRAARSSSREVSSPVGS
jgi:predicted RNA-binding Zn ribbon-like protein